MEMSTVESEWGCKEVSNLQIIIYDSYLASYRTITLDKNLRVSYHINNFGKRSIDIITTIMNPFLWNAILQPEQHYSYKIIAEDIIRTVDGKDRSIKTEYRDFPLVELEWSVDAEGSPAVYKICFKDYEQ